MNEKIQKHEIDRVPGKKKGDPDRTMSRLYVGGTMIGLLEEGQKEGKPETLFHPHPTVPNAVQLYEAHNFADDSPELVPLPEAPTSDPAAGSQAGAPEGGNTGGSPSAPAGAPSGGSQLNLGGGNP